MPLVDLRNLHKRFGHLVVLDGVDLAIPEGQSLVVIGASGTGKSVMLKHIVGLLKPDEGEVYFDDKRIDTLSERDLDVVRQQMGFLFQMGALFDSFNVEENIAFPLREHTTKTAAEIDEIVGQRLAMVGLPDTRKKMPGELSGGQRKRIALARAIALEPRLILYDEPTTGLDPVRSDVINELILKLQRELKVTSITVTHDMHSAYKIADRIVMLHKGKVIFDGTPDEIQQSDDERVRGFVLGEAGPEDLEGLDMGERTPVRQRTGMAKPAPVPDGQPAGGPRAAPVRPPAASQPQPHAAQPSTVAPPAVDNPRPGGRAGEAESGGRRPPRRNRKNPPTGGARNHP
jgi:phospholipid/cholesterol/gamma-HCH transport system ATP-binding protein